MNDKAVLDIVNFVSGIASCATQCPCCRSHSDSAHEALQRFTLRTGITPDDAYHATRNAEKLHVEHEYRRDA